MRAWMNFRGAIAKCVPAVVLVLAIALGSVAHGAELDVVAAESVYGDIAQQVGGNRVHVLSIMSNPDQDPHLFETTPSVLRHVSDAQIVVVNGANYDPWMNKLLAATPRAKRIVVNVDQLAGKKSGDNPHLWYDPNTAPKLAKALSDAFSKADAAHTADFAGRLSTFVASLEPLNDKITAIRSKYAGTAVTASEPVFGYMVDALKLKMRNERFQLSIMNDTEPSARDVAAFERDLKEHKVRVMFYNKQASNKAVQHLVDLARDSKIPVVGVTETAPPDVSYQRWMLDQLTDTEKALVGRST